MKGRKRHIVVDCLSLVFNCWVSAANVADIKAAPVVLVEVLDAVKRTVKVLADQGYQGKLSRRLEQAYHCCLELTTKLGEGFVIQPKRVG